jgi:NAD(P)-dependent dehydrogenase (short-subunit alcohol dehydrogenase family)
MNSKPVAIITGASRGIGRALALELASAGFDIVGISRTLESTDRKKGLNELKPLVESNGAAFLPIQTDIGEIANHANVVQQVIAHFGRIDLLVNNAGEAPPERLDILETTRENFDQVIGTNLRGTFFLSQVIANKMLELKDGIDDFQPKIIFITSISAEVSSPNRAEYCIAKAGLSMTSRIYADRLVDAGIGVFEIRPGIIDTDMTTPVKEKYDKLIAEGLIPQNRWGQPEDVAKAVSAIATGHFDYATGMIIEISGGMNIRRL